MTAKERLARCARCAVLVLSLAAGCTEPNFAYEATIADAPADLPPGSADAGGLAADATASTDAFPPDRVTGDVPGARADAARPGGPVPNDALGPALQPDGGAVLDAPPPDAPLDTAQVARDAGGADIGIQDAGTADVLMLSDVWPADTGQPDSAPPDASPADLAYGQDSEAGSVTTCPADPDLLLCLRFEGAAVDESSQSIPVTATNGRYAPGADGLALDVVEGTRVTTERTPGLVVTSYTVQAWVKPRALPAAGTRAGVVDENTLFSVFVYPDGGVRCAGAGLDFRVPGLVRPGVWSSIACTFEPGRMALWHQGMVQAEKSTPFGLPSALDAQVVVGGNDPGVTTPDPEPFDGLIDNVRVWRRVLTSTEMCASSIGCAK